MTTVMEFQEIKAYLDGLHTATDRGAAIGLLEAVNFGMAEAKKNAVANFTGRFGYRKTGALLNSIFSGFEATDGELEGFVGVRAQKGVDRGEGETKPYGRIQEYGGKVVPRDAKWLWQKLWGNVPAALRFITPRQFMEKKRQFPGNFFLTPSKRGKGFVAMFTYLKYGRKAGAGATANSTPLFYLRDEVTIKARPYVTPAVQEAHRRLPGMILKRILEQQAKQ